MLVEDRYQRPKLLKRGSVTKPLGRAETSTTTKAEELEDLSSHFHISIAWSLEPPSIDGRNALEVAMPENHRLELEISTVKVKIGNNVSAIALSRTLDTTNGIISH